MKNLIRFTTLEGCMEFWRKKEEKQRKCPFCDEENDSGVWYIATSDMSGDYATCCKACHDEAKEGDE